MNKIIYNFAKKAELAGNDYLNARIERPESLAEFSLFARLSAAYLTHIIKKRTRGELKGLDKRPKTKAKGCDICHKETDHYYLIPPNKNIEYTRWVCEDCVEDIAEWGR